MKTKIFTSLTVLMFVSIASIVWADFMPAESGWRNITVFDGQSNSDPKPEYDGWYGTQEDNEVEWGTKKNGKPGGAAIAQLFDLEGMFYNSEAKQLMIIGGYDFSSLELAGRERAGDIFLTAGSQNYVLDVKYNQRHSKSTSYNTTYELYSGNFKTIKSRFIVSSPDYRRQALGGGTAEGKGSVSFFSDIYKDTNVWNGIENTFKGDGKVNKHHALVVDVSWLQDDTFEAYNTMQCGNDVIRGASTSSAVPEPASFLLFGTGLLLFAHRSRRKSDSL